MNALTLVQLSSLALVEGLDQGFNCAEVERWNDADTLELRILVRFGDHKQLLKPRLRMPSDFAQSYDLEAPCTRGPKVIPFDPAMLELSASAIRRWFGDILLELAPA